VEVVQGKDFAVMNFIQNQQLRPGSWPNKLVLGSPVPRLEKNRDRTETRPRGTANSQGPIKTATAVRSSVLHHLKIFKTDENRSQLVSTGLCSLNYILYRMYSS